MDTTASIINIVQITGTLIEYIRAAAQANSDRRKLLLEANTLFALLTSLKDFVAVDDSDDYTEWRQAIHRLEAPNGPFAQYQRDLKALLAKAFPQRRRDKVVQTILWKMTKEDVSEILLRIERMKTLVLVALEMDHTRLSEAILAQISDVALATKLIRADTLKLVSSADDAAFRSLLDQICVEDYANVFQSNVTEHTVGIGQNFIASSEFEGWSDSADASTTLLCLGDPGSGKTVMATKAIEALHSRESHLGEAVIFVYCDCTRRRSRLSRRDSSPEARSKGVQTPGHLLASLLRQLVEAHNTLIPSVQELMSRHERQKTKPKVEELEQAFTEVAQSFDRIYVVVDAMDECDNLEMETFAAHLVAACSPSHLRLLVTSRRHPQIEQIFEDSVRLEMHAYEDDTLRYLRSRAKKEFPPRVLRDSQALDRILSALLLSANGIPLIARLHMNALRGVRTPGAMLATIARLRSNSDVYDETYQAAMERIMKQPGELPAMATKILRWIVCAKRYLHARELRCVLAMRDDSDAFDEDFMPDMDDVFLACEGLVCLVTGSDTDTVRVELVHTTARQYFDRKLAEWAPDVSLDLTRTCLNVLALEDLSPLPSSLIAYAWRHWAQHAKDVEELNEESQMAVLLGVINKFLAGDDTESPLSRTFTVRDKRGLLVDSFQEEATGYHWVARFNLTRVFQALWNPNDDLDTMYGSSQENTNPFCDAIYSGNTEMVQVMLKLRSVNPNIRGTRGLYPLQIAVAIRQKDIVKSLLDQDVVSPNIDLPGRNLLVLAAKMGDESTLKLLLGDAGMDAEVRDDYGPSLLAFASLNEESRMQPNAMTLEDVKEYMANGAVSEQLVKDNHLQ